MTLMKAARYRAYAPQQFETTEKVKNDRGEIVLQKVTKDRFDVVAEGDLAGGVARLTLPRNHGFAYVVFYDGEPDAEHVVARADVTPEISSIQVEAPPEDAA